MQFVVQSVPRHVTTSCQAKFISLSQFVFSESVILLRIYHITEPLIFIETTSLIVTVVDKNDVGTEMYLRWEYDERFQASSRDVCYPLDLPDSLLGFPSGTGSAAGASLAVGVTTTKVLLVLKVEPQCC